MADKSKGHIGKDLGETMDNDFHKVSGQENCRSVDIKMVGIKSRLMNRYLW
jgi:hypothetical protein